MPDKVTTIESFVLLRTWGCFGPCMVCKTVGDNKIYVIEDKTYWACAECKIEVLFTKNQA